MHRGRLNATVGLAAMALFMVYGFLLIYLRDFHPDKLAWIAGYGDGAHFEARLAHVHGNLFALLNLALAFVLARLEGAVRLRRAVAVLGLAGLLMPLGILAEIYLHFPPVLVIVGALAMTVAVALAAAAAWIGWPRTSY